MNFQEEIQQDEKIYLNIISNSLNNKQITYFINNESFKQFFKLLYLYRKCLYKITNDDKIKNNYSNACGILIKCSILIFRGYSDISIVYSRTAMDLFVRNTFKMFNLSFTSKYPKFANLIEQILHYYKELILNNISTISKKKEFKQISNEYSNQIESLYKNLSSSVHFQLNDTESTKIPDVLNMILENENNIEISTFESLNEILAFFLEMFLLLSIFKPNRSIEDLPTMLIDMYILPSTSEKFLKYHKEISIYK